MSSDPMSFCVHYVIGQNVHGPPAFTGLRTIARDGHAGILDYTLQAVHATVSLHLAGMHTQSSRADMAMGWVDPWVGLGWVEFGQI